MNSLPSPRISFGELGKRVFGGEAEDGVGGGIVGEGAEGGGRSLREQHRLVVLDPWQSLLTWPWRPPLRAPAAEPSPRAPA